MDSKCDLSNVRYYRNERVKVGFTLAGSPHWESNDCAVIALSIVADIPYAWAHEILRVDGDRKVGDGPNWPLFLKQGPFKFKQVKLDGHVSLKNFVKTNPEGRFVIMLRPRCRRPKHGEDCHAASVVDGVVYDCDLNSVQCRVKYAWELKGLRKWKLNQTT